MFSDAAQLHDRKRGSSNLPENHRDNGSRTPVVLSVIRRMQGVRAGRAANENSAFQSLDERERRRRNDMAKYGRKAQQKVKRAMHERKRGKLRSGRSGKKVTSRKQAIAIGLSEARRAGAKVPRKRKGRRRSS